MLSTPAALRAPVLRTPDSTPVLDDPAHQLRQHPSSAEIPSSAKHPSRAPRSGAQHSGLHSGARRSGTPTRVHWHIVAPFFGTSLPRALAHRCPVAQLPNGLRPRNPIVPLRSAALLASKTLPRQVEVLLTDSTSTPSVFPFFYSFLLKFDQF